MTIEDISQSPRPLPSFIAWFVGGLCALPTLLLLTPAKEPIFALLNQISLNQSQLIFFHNMLEGAAFFTAFFTVVLALAHFMIRTDPVTPVLGISLFASGLVDVLHLFVVNNLLHPIGDVTSYEPFTWTISRLAMSAICLFGVITLTWAKPNQSLKSGTRSILFLSGAIGIITLVTTVLALSKPLPQAIYPDSLFVRPWDLIPLFTFGLSSIVFLNFYRNFPSTFSHALILSTIPNFVSQLHMAMGAERPFDYHSIMAHFLKIIAYLIPFIGLLIDYIRTYMSYEVLVKKLNDESEAKSRFVANVSHEIRTPMTAIIGAAEILSEKAKSPEEKKHLSTIISAGENLTALVNDLLDLAKAQAGKMTLEMRPTELVFAIGDCVNLFQAKALQKRLQISYTSNFDAPKFVLTDSLRLKQIIYNLLANAIKFTDQGLISLKLTRQHADTFLIEVEDTGIGIPLEKQKVIFDQFIQADDSTTRKFGGTGLGLSITKNLVTLFGGKISLRSVPGQGTCFAVELPLKEISNPEVLENANKSQGIIKTVAPLFPILVVDDVEINRDLVVEFLSEIECHTEQASSGEQALELIKQKRYSVILMDVQMPGIDGLTTTKHIREFEAANKLPRTPIIAFTAHASSDEEKKAKSFGCDFHLPKPIRKSNLISLVNSAILEHQRRA